MKKQTSPKKKQTNLSATMKHGNPQKYTKFQHKFGQSKRQENLKQSKYNPKNPHQKKEETNLSATMKRGNPQKYTKFQHKFGQSKRQENLKQSKYNPKNPHQMKHRKPQMYTKFHYKFGQSNMQANLKQQKYNPINPQSKTKLSTTMKPPPRQMYTRFQHKFGKPKMVANIRQPRNLQQEKKQTNFSATMKHGNPQKYTKFHHKFGQSKRQENLKPSKYNFKNPHQKNKIAKVQSVAEHRRGQKPNRFHCKSGQMKMSANVQQQNLHKKSAQNRRSVGAEQRKKVKTIKAKFPKRQTGSAIKKQRVKNKPKEQLQHSYVAVPMEKRLSALFTLFKHVRSRKMKVAIVFNSVPGVEFCNELYSYIYEKITTHCLLETFRGGKRMSILKKFKKEESGILLCTENVLEISDISTADWIVQFDPPLHAEKYIDRLKRMAPNKGRTLLFICENERSFVSLLESHKIEMSERINPWKKMADFTNNIENLIKNKYFIYIAARQAYTAYVKAYNTHPNKSCFNLSELSITKIGQCYGFNVPPWVNLETPSETEKRKREDEEVEAKKKKMKMKVKRTFVLVNS